MSEKNQIDIVNDEDLRHEFSPEIIERIHDYISEKYKQNVKIVIKSPTQADLLSTKNIIFLNDVDYSIEPEEPSYKLRMPIYFLEINDSSVKAVINPDYKKAISSDFASLKLEYDGVKNFPFLKGKLLNDGFSFSIKKEQIDGFNVENISTIHDTEICKQITKTINSSHKDNLYFSIEDNQIWVIATRPLETLKTQYVSSGYEKLASYSFNEDGTLNTTPNLYKSKEYLSELAIPLFSYSKKKPQVLRQIEFMLKVLYGDSFTVEITYDDESKADIAIIKLVNSVYKLEINDMAFVYKNGKLVNFGQKSDPYTILIKEMIKPYTEHLYTNEWTLEEYENYKELVHSGLFY